jgi:uncharacterized protein with HEPN domain
MACVPSDDPSGRVDDIFRAIARIEVYVEKAGGIDGLLAEQNELYDAVERRPMILSEAAVKLGPLAEAMEPGIPWRDIRGLGNALRHSYDKVNLEIVRVIIDTHLPPLAAACERMKSVLPKRAEPE